MKKTNAIIFLGLALALSANSFAQDFDDFGSFGDFEDESASSSKLELNGSASVEVRAYVDSDKAEDVEVKATPSGKLSLKYDGNKSDMNITLSIDAEKVKSHPEDIVDELVLRGYFGNFMLETGKLKVVWGKGDKLHVFDNFNADDYSDFIITDYIDRRISTPMIRGTYSFPAANINLEAIYTPLLPTDHFATEGRWEPAQLSSLTDGATKIVSMNLLGLEAKAAAANAEAAAETSASAKAAKQQAAIAADKAYLEYLTYANELSSNPDSIFPDLMNLKYSQYGARILGTVGIFDFGASYYYGWYKQPSVNYSSYIESIDGMKATIASNPTTLGAAYAGLISQGKSQSEALQSLAVANAWQFDLPTLDYDRKQTFAVEGATVVWHFNLRGEFAYNLTDDFDGTDPWVHNNSIAWLGGFDIDLPFWNANLNVQETGTLILHGDECDTNQNQYAEYNANDVDYSKNGYTNNKIVCNFTTSFLNDRLTPEITALYGIENGDLVILPSLTYKPDQNLTLTAKGMYIWCRDEYSEFSVWEKNSFVSLSAQYQF
ncbi:MAG: hypothetical protein IKQ43_03740 [Treponema sp.]|nr:hypothetical protein [Treponema sp.]